MWLAFEFLLLVLSFIHKFCLKMLDMKIFLLFFSNKVTGCIQILEIEEL